MFKKNTHFLHSLFSGRRYKMRKPKGLLGCGGDIMSKSLKNFIFISEIGKSDLFSLDHLREDLCIYLKNIQINTNRMCLRVE